MLIFSDTHFKETGITAKQVSEKINEQNVDVVIFLGDLIDNYEQDKEHLDILDITEALSEINATHKLAIMGNHDYGGGAFGIYKEILENSGFTLLINETYDIDGLSFVGLDDSIFGNPDTSIIESYENTVVLTHEGDTSDDFSEGFGLALAGHSHGGQVNIPFVKDLFLPIGSKKYVKGIYELNESDKVFVTSGIGTSRFDARIFNIPEIIKLNINY